VSLTTRPITERSIAYRHAVARLRLHNDDFGYESNCFVCEQRNEDGLRIPFFHDTERELVTADFSLSGAYSGAPTMLHGGVTLAVLDEAMAWACIAIGRQWAVTSETTARFQRAVYVDKPHVVEAEIVRQTDSEIMTSARILNVKGLVRVEATATFTKLGEAQLKRAAGETGDTIDASLRLD
jgi:acyl-coenzyme A thioesterase PaaI-like protein